MGTKSLTKLYNIFIDTGIFIDLLKIDIENSTETVKKRINQTNRFFDALAAQNRKITFQTSSINVAELFHCGGKHKETIMAMVSLVNGSGELEVISFDPDVATYHNSWLQTYLSNASIQEIKQLVNYPIDTKFANVEDRIRKDMLICSTAKMYNVDIVLTNDGGFKTLCDKLDLPCHCFTGDESDFTTSHGTGKIYDFAK
jgi:predicted nucleic acid-binding protein